MFKLWYKYLRVTGSAFTGTPDGTLSSKSSVFYPRDAELLGKNKRKRRQKKADDDDDEDELELCSHFSDEEFYEGKRSTSTATFPKNRHLMITLKPPSSGQPFIRDTEIPLILNTI